MSRAYRTSVPIPIHALFFQQFPSVPDLIVVTCTTPASFFVHADCSDMHNASGTSSMKNDCDNRSFDASAHGHWRDGVPEQGRRGGGYAEGDGEGKDPSHVSCWTNEVVSEKAAKVREVVRFGVGRWEHGAGGERMSHWYDHGHCCASLCTSAAERADQEPATEALMADLVKPRGAAITEMENPLVAVVSAMEWSRERSAECLRFDQNTRGGLRGEMLMIFVAEYAAYLIKQLGAKMISGELWVATKERTHEVRSVRR